MFGIVSEPCRIKEIDTLNFLIRKPIWPPSETSGCYNRQSRGLFGSARCRGKFHTPSIERKTD